jgi:hypothetical protein
VTLSGFDGPVGDFALELGYVTGVRGFALDYFGRLRGITHSEAFNPGVNVATCYAGCKTKDMGNCSCGYYAYFVTDRTKMRYATDGNVGAIIRGYGQTVVGTKGFRSLKADLVALFDMQQLPQTKATHPTKKSIFRNLYPSYKTFVLWCDKPETYARVSVNLLFSWLATGAIIATLAIFVGLWVAAPLFLVYLWLFGFSRRWQAAEPAHAAYRWSSLYSKSAGDRLARLTNDPDNFYGKTTALWGPVRAEDLRETLAGMYPDVPYYETMEEALAAHPIDLPAEDTGKRNVMNQSFQMPNVQPQLSADIQAAMIKAAQEFRRKYGLS